MELIMFAAILILMAASAVAFGADSRPGERDHAHNW